MTYIALSIDPQKPTKGEFPQKPVLFLPLSSSIIGSSIAEALSQAILEH
jgi:hypothetical protein